MNQKAQKTLVFIILVVIVVAVSAWLGDYAAAMMRASTTAKNGMLCQIIFFIGLVGGIALCMLSQDLERRYPSSDRNERLKEEQIS